MKFDIAEKYNLSTITRGQVRKIEAVKGSEQTDLLVQMTVGADVAIDDLPMPDFVAITKWAVDVNGLDGSAFEAAKKN